MWTLPLTDRNWFLPVATALLGCGVLTVSFPRRLKGHRSPIWEVAISPGGRTLATASRDDTIKLWTSDGTLLKTLKANTRGVMAVDFRPDGQMLVTGGSSGALKLWKTDGTEITTLTGHEGNVWGVAFSPDGKQIASVGTIALSFCGMWSEFSNSMNWLMRAIAPGIICELMHK